MLIQLNPGDTIKALREISHSMIQYWKFANDCQNYGRSFAPGTSFVIAEINKIPGNIWVKVNIPGSDPVQHLKIAGNEFAHNFR